MSTIDNYTLKKNLGSGAFSKVKLAETPDGKEVALKISQRSQDNENICKQDNQELFYTEAEALQELSHPYIIKYFDHAEVSYFVRKDGTFARVRYIALEYLPQGEIFDYVAQSGRFAEEEARYYFKQLLEAIEYLHCSGYAHRDIKLENILMDENFNLRLADFGFATRSRRSCNRKGTFGYMAPEVLAKQEYDCRQHDLYAAAIVLFILATEHPPFTTADPEDQYFKRICSEEWPEFWRVHQECELSESFKDLLSQMLAYDPNKRLTLAQIKKHEWVNGPEISRDEIFERFTKRRNLLTKTHHSGKSCFERTFPTQRIVTDFYQVEDGDQLLDIAIKFACKNKYKCQKSKTYFRAQIKVEEFGEETIILISILKKPNSYKRAVEFRKTSGDGITFNSTTRKLRKYLDFFFSPYQEDKENVAN